MPDTPPPRQNRILAALPATDYARLSPHLDAIQMHFGHIIHESGGPLRHLYFPTTAIVSLLHVMEDGASAEITGVGNEGMIGTAVFAGGIAMPHRAMVLCAGHAYRMPAPVLMNELNRPGGGYRGIASFIAVLHAGTDDADSSDCRLQSASLDTAAAVSLVAVKSRQVILE